jgi:hypothetical protein
MIQFDVRQLKNINKLGEGNFAVVSLVQLEHKPNVIFACKVCLFYLFLKSVKVEFDFRE